VTSHFDIVLPFKFSLPSSFPINFSVFLISSALAATFFFPVIFLDYFASAWIIGVEC